MADRYITQVTLPDDNNNYYIKDANATREITDLKNSLTKALRYRGTTSDTNLKDNARVTTLAGIDTTNNPFRTGDIVLKTGTGDETKTQAPQEYIFNGEKWNEFGSTGSLGPLAFGSKVTGSGTPSGTVGENISGTIDTTPVLKGNAYTINSSYTPSGSVNIQVENLDLDISTSGTIPNSVAVNVNRTNSNTYTPQGTISAPQFTGIAGDVTISSMETSANPTYTPAGTILYDGQIATSPQVNVVLNTGKVNGVKTRGTLPALNYTVTGEELKINWNAGSLLTTEEKDFATTVSSATMKAFTFVGKGAHFSGRHTPSGTINAPTFTGTSVPIEATLTGSRNISFSGSINTPITASATFSGNTGNAVGQVVPSATEWYVGPLSLNMQQMTITSQVSS